MWSWTKLSSSKWEDAWSERIAGNPNAVIETIKGGKSIRITVYTETENDAIILRDYFGGTVRQIKTRDWISGQANANRPPLIIRNTLAITEQTDPEELEKLHRRYPKRQLLTIPAEMAFGTGDHATTSTCLRLISDYAVHHKKQPWSITDIGCGTGLLALAAIKLGATRGTAFDFDPIAVEVARSNAVRNHESNELLSIFVGDIFEWTPEESQKSDLVTANLFSTILQKAFPRIISTMRPNGLLIISGILHTQWEETKKSAETEGLEIVKIIRKGKWLTASAIMKH